LTSTWQLLQVAAMPDLSSGVARGTGGWTTTGGNHHHHRLLRQKAAAHNKMYSKIDKH